MLFFDRVFQVGSGDETRGIPGLPSSAWNPALVSSVSVNLFVPLHSSQHKKKSFCIWYINNWHSVQTGHYGIKYSGSNTIVSVYLLQWIYMPVSFPGTQKIKQSPWYIIYTLFAHAQQPRLFWATWKLCKTYSATPNGRCQSDGSFNVKISANFSLPGERPPCRIMLPISLKPRPSLRVEGRSGFETRHIEGFQWKSQ